MVSMASDEDSKQLLFVVTWIKAQENTSVCI